MSRVMDRELRQEGRRILQLDKEWRQDILSLPHEDIVVPLYELPDPEPDHGVPMESLREQEHKWTDLALGMLTQESHINQQGQV